MGNVVLGQMIVTSLAPILPGLYFLLMVEPAEGLKAYRYKFLVKDDMLEEVNNAFTVGLVGYTLFVATVPFMDWFFASTFGTPVTEAVNAAGIWIQVTILVLLTGMNMTMAYLGLQK